MAKSDCGDVGCKKFVNKWTHEKDAASAVPPSFASFSFASMTSVVNCAIFMLEGNLTRASILRAAELSPDLCSNL